MTPEKISAIPYNENVETTQHIQEENLKSMKKFLALLLVAVMTLSVAACGSDSSDETDTGSDAAAGTEEEVTGGSGIAAADLKVGMICIGDENEGYSVNHMNGLNEAKDSFGMDDSQIIFKTNVSEDETCYDAIIDLAEQGCQLIFGTSLGYEDFMLEAAREYPDIEFCHGTGYQAESSGLSNIHNYFASIYEARYVGGVVAGMKLNNMLENGEISEAKIGYVGAYPYAEVISGYTAFYLGARSVCESATMEVKYTNSWGDFSLEKECAEALIADGCVLISQHADTTGAPTACEAAGVPCVGYNISMMDVAPNTALTSAAINWGPYYTYVLQCVIDGTAIDVDWCQGYADDTVCLTEINDAIVPEGTQEAADEAAEAIRSGELQVFDTDTWTVNGEHLDSYEINGQEYISDGYFHESTYGSCPVFDIVIDGVTAVE